MATQTIEFRAAPGLTLTAELFAIGSDTIVATVSPTEQTNRAGTYRAVYTSIAAAEYQLVAFSGTTPVASWLVTLTLTTATFQVYERSTAVNDAAIAIEVWDRILTGATHNISGSAGRRLRQLGASSIYNGTAQSGAANSILLDTGASATSEIYDSNLVVIVEGTGAGQSRVIVEYNGTTKVAIVDRVWEVTPDATSEFQIIADHQADITQHGIAQGGAASSITLSAAASSQNNIYRGQSISLRTSTGAGQLRLITAYDGTTKVATVAPPWDINPTATSVYAIYPIGSVIVESLSADAIASIGGGSATEGDWAIRRTFQLSDATKVPGVQMSLAGVAGKVDTTGSDGVAQINTDDGTFTLRVTVPFGYESVADSTVVIGGADSVAVVVLVSSAPAAPANPAKSALQVLCVDESGDPEPGVAIDLRIVKIPNGSADIAFKGSKQTATSDGDGIASFEAYKSGTYQIKRGTADEWDTITIGSGDTTSVTSFIGSP